MPIRMARGPAGTVKVATSARVAGTRAAKSSCGSGKGGFKPGNTCGASGRVGSPEASTKASAKTTDTPSTGVQAPPAADSAGHAAAHAVGHPAIGLKYAKPTGTQAALARDIHKRLAKGKSITPDERNHLIDYHAYKANRASDGGDEYDHYGHRFVFHDRTYDAYHSDSEFSLSGYGDNYRKQYEAGGTIVPIRQFNSAGVEVPVDPARLAARLAVPYRKATGPFYATKPERAAEAAAARRVPRAKFGTAEPVATARTTNS